MATMNINIRVHHKSDEQLEKSVDGMAVHVVIAEPYEWFGCPSLEDAGELISDYIQRRMGFWQDSLDEESGE